MADGWHDRVRRRDSLGKLGMAMRKHFLLPENKHTQNILTNFRYDDYPDDLQEYLENPETAKKSFDEMQLEIMVP